MEEARLEKTENPNAVLNRKLRQFFDGKIVRKDLTKSIKEGANVPVYVLEFLLGQYCSSDDPEIMEQKIAKEEDKKDEKKKDEENQGSEKTKLEMNPTAENSDAGENVEPQATEE